jgi:hypothetical protein
MASDGFHDDYTVVSFHYDNDEPQYFGMDEQPEDWQIGEADAIVIGHLDDNGEIDDYWTVHGADDYESLEDLADYYEGIYQ